MPITTYPSLVYGTRYPAIPHLAGSAFGDGDVVLSEAETRAVLSRPVVATEKLDGLNVGISFVRGVPRVHSRVRGVITLDRLGPGLWPLVDFVFEHLGPLWRLLGNHSIVFGEWLEGAPSVLPYPRRQVAFVAFDLVDRARGFMRPTRAHRTLAAAGFAVPLPVFQGVAGAVEALWPLTRTSRFGGPAEGLVLSQGARCFKLVRPDFVTRRVVKPPKLPRARLPAPVRARATVTKVFEPGDVGRDVEVERLRLVRGLGPGLRRVEGAEVVMGKVPGKAVRASASLPEVAAVGRSLAALHRVPTSLPLGALEPKPSQQLRRAMKLVGRDDWSAALPSLLRLVRAMESGLPHHPVVCHGDLKPEHVRLHEGVARFLDFESAVIADGAWELGAAFERLDLDGRQRVALARAWSAGDGTSFLRAWLFRLVWWVMQPAALQGVALSASGARIVARSEGRARALLGALGGVSVGRLRQG
ncbi:MAG: phosphotransferase [Myxococcus sp.]|nr:phosphotransferase [Myxococcus sp.]